MASENAKPKIAYEKSCPLRRGFLETPIINAPNTTPIPIPAPINPVVAKPVPIILADCSTIQKKREIIIFLYLTIIIRIINKYKKILIIKRFYGTYFC